MIARTLPVLLIIAALILTAILAIVFSPQLPNRIASHFGIDGKPNGFMGKDAFLITMVALQFGLAIFLTGMGWIAAKLPKSMINIPHREYWLHADRATETLSWLQGVMNWITACTTTFMALIFYLVIQANLQAEVKLPTLGFTLLMVAYLIAILILVVRITLHFRRIPAS